MFVSAAMTHAGQKSGKAMRPTIAAAAIKSGLLTFQRNKTTKDIKPMSNVSQSPIAIRPKSTHAPKMVPIAAA